MRPQDEELVRGIFAKPVEIDGVGFAIVLLAEFIHDNSVNEEMAMKAVTEIAHVIKDDLRLLYNQ